MTLASVTSPLSPKCLRSCWSVQCFGRFLTHIREDIGVGQLMQCWAEAAQGLMDRDLASSRRAFKVAEPGPGSRRLRLHPTASREDVSIFFILHHISIRADMKTPALSECPGCGAAGDLSGLSKVPLLLLLWLMRLARLSASPTGNKLHVVGALSPACFTNSHPLQIVAETDCSFVCKQPPSEFQSAAFKVTLERYKVEEAAATAWAKPRKPESLLRQSA